MMRCPSHAYFFGQTKHGKFEAAVPLLPTCFSVESLKEYVSRETQLQYEDIEIRMKDLSINGLGANCAQDKNRLILAYRLKERD
ncbi:hypothetical protein ACSBR1_012602 [Camellia fascicularis]